MIVVLFMSYLWQILIVQVFILSKYKKSSSSFVSISNHYKMFYKLTYKLYLLLFSSPLFSTSYPAHFFAIRGRAKRCFKMFWLCCFYIATPLFFLHRLQNLTSVSHPLLSKEPYPRALKGDLWGTYKSTWHSTFVM